MYISLHNNIRNTKRAACGLYNIIFCLTRVDHININRARAQQKLLTHATQTPHGRTRFINTINIIIIIFRKPINSSTWQANAFANNNARVYVCILRVIHRVVVILPPFVDRNVQRGWLG